MNDDERRRWWWIINLGVSYLLMMNCYHFSLNVEDEKNKTPKNRTNPERNNTRKPKKKNRRCEKEIKTHI